MESEVADPSAAEQHTEPFLNKQTAHADIQSLQESAEINGKVVLLSRGGCGFLEKVKWAQRRGGIALIVGDDTRGGSLVTMYARGDTSNVTIPALFTSHTTAQLLSSLVPAQDEDIIADESPAAKLSTHGAKQRVESTTTTTAVSSPTSTRSAATGTPSASAQHKEGLFRGVLSLLGVNSHRTGHISQDSQRPPTSGNIDWILMDPWDDPEASSKGRAKDSATDVRQTGDGDGFVIGVQDWRDPDLVAPMSSSIAAPTSVSQTDGSHSTHGPLKGGSITPGSGEYRTIEKPSANKEANVKTVASQDAEADKKESVQSGSWFAKHFGWVKESEPEPSLSSRDYSEARKLQNDSAQKRQGAKVLEHEGLWVTLTPTSMSTSPFFDTLLVLVVSPLLTLTVVYVLLLLRSRIRRRRWRAPKSLVDRLPVRTYHTISTPSSSSSIRSVSPGPVSPTSPLLGYSALPGYRSRSTIDSPKSPSKKEKSGSSTLWRRKYTGRQVECVVCLEEYVDGQSRVMSLPCGHEFHAECMAVETASESTESTTHSDHDSGSHNASAPVPIAGLSEDEMSDPERQTGPADGLLSGQSSSAPQPGWRNFAALSFSALSGDTIWHQGRTDSDHR
ncbi:hypothetical protein ATERTT37_006423 [Aspergillus terreus]